MAMSFERTKHDQPDAPVHLIGEEYFTLIAPLYPPYPKAKPIHVGEQTVNGAERYEAGMNWIRTTIEYLENTPGRHADRLRQSLQAILDGNVTAEQQVLEFIPEVAMAIGLLLKMRARLIPDVFHLRYANHMPADAPMLMSHMCEHVLSSPEADRHVCPSVIAMTWAFSKQLSAFYNPMIKYPSLNDFLHSSLVRDLPSRPPDSEGDYYRAAERFQAQHGRLPTFADSKSDPGLSNVFKTERDFGKRSLMMERVCDALHIN